MLKAPFPYFGGKSKIAPVIWRAFGNPANYVEPFAGSLAVLLSRPEEQLASSHVETINDADGLLANFWRSMNHDPEAVIVAAENPVNECDLHARHLWLVERRASITERLMGDPDWCDPKAAGWWVWGLCCWIGSGWCSGNGPWVSVGGVFTDSRKSEGNAGQGVKRQLPHLGNAGQGVNRQLTHLGNAGQGVNRQLPHLGDAGQGVNRQLPHLGNAGRGVNRQLPHLGNAGRGLTRQRYWLETIIERMLDVRVACGDWSRVVKGSVLYPNRSGKEATAVFLDPPYSVGSELYATGRSDVRKDVRDWCAEHGSDERLRIALCGYEGEHELPGWTVHKWKASQGYSGGTDNNNHLRETLWLSPNCLPIESQLGIAV